MRLRNIPGAGDIVSASSFFVHNPRSHRGQWFRFLGNERPIYVEIGMGKGHFLTQLARQNPDINYIGVERYSSVLLRAVQLIEKDPLPNVHFLCVDAASLPEIFEKGEVDRIYLNFPDPWPKERHARRRLTSPNFLNRYAHLLAEDGQIEFKTDNQDLFDYSIDMINESDIWRIDACTRDLHNDDDLSIDNAMSEYERKFSSEGHPICKLIAKYLDYAWEIYPPIPDISHQPRPWELDDNQDSDSDRLDGNSNQTYAPISDCNSASVGCLKAQAWCEGEAGSNIYSIVIRLVHNGRHQSFGQDLTLQLSQPVGLVETPGDVYADTDGCYVHVHRNNQMTADGLTEIWLKLSCGAFPSVQHIYDLNCRY